MSVRSLSALALGFLLVLAGCSDDGDGSSSDGTNASQESTTEATGPTYTQFADFPGEELLYIEAGMPVGLRVKVVDSAWTTELGGEPAEAGSHFLTVYVAVTGELDDRPVEDAHFNSFGVEARYKAEMGDDLTLTDGCGDGYCSGLLYPSTLFEQVADNEWRDHLWTTTQYSGSTVEAGQTAIGALALSVKDDAMDTIVKDIQFCATTRDGEDGFTYGGESPCIKIPAPDPQK